MFCFAFYAYVSCSLCCFGSKNEVIHFPMDKFQSKTWARQILDKYFTSFATLGLALSSALSMLKCCTRRAWEVALKYYSDSVRGLMPI